MAYTLFAVLAQPPLLEADPLWIADSRVIALEQGIRMIPVTDTLYDLLVQQHMPVPKEAWTGFVLSPAPLTAPLCQLSQGGAVAYVEAEYFGGTGEQRCVVWRDGSLTLGPLEDRNAINKALRQLGVKRQAFRDEFDAVGLDRHRSSEDWINSVGSS